MRIAFHVPRARYLDLSVSGGDAIFVQNLLAALRERGHDVKIASTLDVREFWRGRRSARKLIAEVVTVRRQMRQFAPDAWLVYSASVPYPDFLGWWRNSGRYVMFGADVGRKEQLPYAWRWLFVYAHRRSLMRADAIIVERPASAKHLHEAGVARERLHIFPAASRCWHRIPTQVEARQRLGLPQDAPVLLCLCRFTMPEGTRGGKTLMALDLLAAFALLPEHVLLVILGDDGPGQGLVEQEIAQRKLGRRVRLIRPQERARLVGSISNEDVKWFYAACDLYAYPHTLDRPWLSLVEAQACGRPVVTMRTPSTELIVDSGRTGFLAKDLHEFRTHAAVLASDRQRCAAMGLAAREYVAQFHSMEGQVRKIEALLLSSDSVAASTVRTTA